MGKFISFCSSTVSTAITKKNTNKYFALTKYAFKKLPFGRELVSVDLERKYQKAIDELRQEADTQGWGGRPLEEDRYYLERLFAPVQYRGPPGTVECLACERELAIEETSLCQVLPESEPDTGETA